MPSAPGGGGDNGAGDSGGGDNGGNDNGGNDNGGNDGGGDNGDGDNGGGDNGADPSDFNFVFTSLIPDSLGDVVAGEEIVAVGTGLENGVQYVNATNGETNPRNVSNSNFDTFERAGFAVTGKWIIIRNFNGNVTVFDTETDTGTIIEEAQLKKPSGGSVPGLQEFWAEDGFVVTVGETQQTFKMIDLNQTPPVVSTFADPGVVPVQFRENEITLLALDVASGQMVAQITDFLVVYDINNPGAAPQVHDLSGDGGVSNAFTFRIDGGHALYQAHEKSGNGREIYRLADLSDGSSTQLERNPGRNEEFDFAGGTFGYFVFEQDSDAGVNGTGRGVVGEIGANGPEFTIVPPSPNPLGEDPADGNRGYGCSVAVTPNGEWIFIAGCGVTLANGEYFQFSRNGSDFELVPDELDEDFFEFGLKATEVDASNEVVAFLSASGVTYAVLPQ